jgi:sugar lactone lactonase YvrE
MRLLTAGLLTLVVSRPAFDQTHSVTTFASGGVPVTGPATVAGLGSVSGIAVDPAGNVIFPSSGYTAVFRLDSSGILTLVAGNGTEGYSGDNGPATSAQLAPWRGVAVDASGNLFIADGSNNRIRKVSNGVITTVAGNGTLGFSGDNGPAANAELSSPADVAVDAAGNLYFVDLGNYRIRKISKGVITTVAGNGTRGFSGDNGPAISAQFQSPGGIALDATGNLYIADTYNSRIRKVSNGVITTIAGGGTPGCCFYPHGIAVDAAGTLYTADILANRIEKVSDGVITTFAGNGSRGFSGDNGPATRAELNSPAGVAVDGSGNLYIADMENHRIRKVSNGVITTVAGNGMKALSDAAALTAPLAPEIGDPYGILQGKYKDGCVPDGDVQAIGEELRAIRKAVPAVAKVHEPGIYAPRQLLLSLTELWPPSLSAEDKRARVKEMNLHPLTTGIRKLDGLNKEFGAVRIEDIFPESDWVSIYFGKPLDMLCVAEAYKRLVEKVEPNFLMGDGDHIYRAQKKGEPLHYVFRIGSGDCPAGCIHETVYYFNLHPDGNGYRIERVDGPQLYHSLWGYPNRFPVRIFESFDDLLKQTKNADWSMRLHAVSALGRVYASGGSGLGEDVFGFREKEGSTVVKRTAGIIDQINKNPDAVKGLLERIAADDSDDDVRRAAKSALRAKEELGRKQ